MISSVSEALGLAFFVSFFSFKFDLGFFILGVLPATFAGFAFARLSAFPEFAEEAEDFCGFSSTFDFCPALSKTCGLEDFFACFEAGFFGEAFGADLDAFFWAADFAGFFAGAAEGFAAFEAPAFADLFAFALFVFLVVAIIAVIVFP